MNVHVVNMETNKKKLHFSLFKKPLENGFVEWNSKTILSLEQSKEKRETKC